MRKINTFLVFFLMIVSTYGALAIGNTIACQRISAGSFHAIEIRNGNLWATGNNASGQLGDNSINSTSSFILISSSGDWAKISCGGNHTLGIKTDGSLWAWGSNVFGQLGNNSNIDNLIPVRIGTNADWANIDAGYSHSVGLKLDGSLWSWGWNMYGQLGRGNLLNSSIPIRISTGTWISISAGDSHTMAIQSDGSLWAWGRNNKGQLGNGNHALTNVTSPAAIAPSTTWASIASGSNHSLAIKSDGTLWAWGYNSNGQIGDGSIIQKLIPTQVNGDSDWLTADAGGSNSLALKADGTIWTWGNNIIGQLGDGLNSDVYIPQKLTTLSACTQIAIGYAFAFVVQLDGTLLSWGDNNHGQLGIGISTSSNLPAFVSKTEFACNLDPLPLTWLSFGGESLTSSTILLKWKTTNEDNVKGFKIYKSLDGLKFIEIGFESVSNHNFTSVNEYNFLDNSFKGSAYYYIEQLDHDGITSGSKKIFMESTNYIVDIYPIPSNNVIHVNLNEQTLIKQIIVFDTFGKELLNQLFENKNQATIDITGISNGVYNMQIITNDRQLFKSIIKN